MHGRILVASQHVHGILPFVETRLKLAIVHFSECACNLLVYMGQMAPLFSVLASINKMDHMIMT